MNIDIILSPLLGLVFVASATPKLRHPQGFLLTVLEYRILPRQLAQLYARLLPRLEFLLALAFLTGTAVRPVALFAALLLASFMIAVSINLVRHRDLECHCFGHSAPRPIGWGLLIQDGVLLGASLALVMFGHQWVVLELWSPFHLIPFPVIGSAEALVICVALTACASIYLGGAVPHGRRWS